ncbi:sporulation-delaying protein SdpB family protein [Micromonospora sp. AKA38]|uniref:sporulation-delaying protein SdpB family protein n=1 Tax=Micromonospora sp. AKA38 TaxID=2733861 RepID=UPI0022C06B1B|nr:sporulation-delaying protein SdpB family protein [Micromonospora sp. AKA38]GHJ15484.1 hypothetical protein TPA0908_34790 [Micromonospora sp. AKA38]
MLTSLSLHKLTRERLPTGYGLPRSLLSLATLSVVGINPPAILFPPTPADASGRRCDGIAAAGLWCIAGDSSNSQAIVRWLSIIVLTVCLIGWRPSWTCLPHWYVTASLATALPMPSGGDYVAQIMTMLLVPLALGDRRRWHWGATRRTPRWQGAADAALLVVRVQLSVIYLVATAAKLTQGEWRDGTALPAALTNPVSGIASGLTPLVEPLAGSPLGTATTWLVLGVEVSLAVLVLAPVPYRRLALALGIALHGAIAVLLGIPTFGMVMIAALALAATSVPAPPIASRGATPTPAHAPLSQENPDALAR